MFLNELSVREQKDLSENKKRVCRCRVSGFVLPRQGPIPYRPEASEICVRPLNFANHRLAGH